MLQGGSMSICVHSEHIIIIISTLTLIFFSFAWHPSSSSWTVNKIQFLEWINNLCMGKHQYHHWYSRTWWSLINWFSFSIKTCQFLITRSAWFQLLCKYKFISVFQDCNFPLKWLTSWNVRKIVVFTRSTSKYQFASQRARDMMKRDIWIESIQYPKAHD